MRWIVLIIALSLTGCANRVTAPADPEDPVSVFLLDHGRHSSIVLPHGSDAAIRYSYGDWDWYALNRKGPLRAIGTLFIPGQAALGRREFDEGATIDTIHAQVHVPTLSVWELQVSESEAAALRRRLDDLFEAAAETRIVNSLYDLDFVHHPDRYSLFHNSNHVAAGWLQEMGVDVRKRTVLSTWQVEDASGME